MSFLYLYVTNFIKVKLGVKLTILDYFVIFLVIEKLSFILNTIIVDFISFSEFEYTVKFHMVEPVGQNISTGSASVTQTDSNNRIVQDIYYHGTWPDAIRTLFIFGAGAYKIRLARNPRSITWTVASTLATDLGAQAVKRAFDDPSWVRAHIRNWKISYIGEGEVDVQVSTTQTAVDAITQNAPLPSTDTNSVNYAYQSLDNFTSNLLERTGLDIDKMLVTLLDYFNLRPMSVALMTPDAKELLAEQHYIIAIGILILSVAAIVLFIILVFNLILYSYKDKLISYFKNEYIIGYINIVTKFIISEIMFISLIMIYNLYYVLRAAHFLVTHPLANL